MPPDPVLSRELKSLQEELAASQRKRPAKSADKPAKPTVETGADEKGAGVGAAEIGAAPTGRPEEAATEEELSSQLRDLVKEITDFVDEAEENVSAHPAMSIVAALLLGIAIGSMLARR